MTTRARAAVADPRGLRRTDRGAAGRAWATFIGLALLSGLGCAFELADVLRPNDGAGGGDGTGDGGPNAGDGEVADGDTGGSTDGGVTRLGSACPSSISVARIAVSSDSAYALCSNNGLIDPLGRLFEGPASGGAFRPLLPFSVAAVVAVGAAVIVVGNGSVSRLDGTQLALWEHLVSATAAAGTTFVLDGYGSDGIMAIDVDAPCADAGACLRRIGNPRSSSFGLVLSGGLAFSRECGVGNGGMGDIHSVAAVPLDGSSADAGALPLIYTSARTGLCGKVPLGIGAVGASVYFPDANDITACAASSSPCTPSTAFREPADVKLLTSDGATLYWVSGSAVRAAKPGGSATTLASSGVEVTALTVAGGQVYWGDASGSLYRVPAP